MRSTKLAKKAVEEGISLTVKRIKLIKLADRNEFGWAIVSEYLSDELASNSERTKSAFFVPRGVLGVVLNRQRVAIGSRRRTGGTRSRPLISRLRDLLPQVGFNPGTLLPG